MQKRNRRGDVVPLSSVSRQPTVVARHPNVTPFTVAVEEACVASLREAAYEVSDDDGADGRCHDDDGCGNSGGTSASEAGAGWSACRANGFVLSAGGSSTSGSVRRHGRSLSEYRGARKSDLVRRERVHSGEKPFACSQCEYRCSAKYHLMEHERVHSGEKPFACSQCEYRCSQKQDLVVHERVHSGEKPFACSVCEYRCPIKSRLVIHERMHSGEKPFGCSLCEYRCSDKRNLLRHERVHSG